MRANRPVLRRAVVGWMHPAVANRTANVRNDSEIVAAFSAKE